MSSELVILSGGQDSTTVLFTAMQLDNPVHAITFNYGQRHAVEIEAAKKVAEIAKVNSHEVIYVPDVLKGSSPLVNRSEQVEQYASATVLPGGLEKTFVPGRNLLFLTIAANRAYNLQCNGIWIGVSQEDYGGYPDCRKEFLADAERAIQQGLRYNEQDTFNPHIVAPLLHLNKKQTVMLAHDMPNRCWEALSYSHTCYNGHVPPCGSCHACLLRARGFAEAGFVDPLIERLTDEGAIHG